MIEITAINPASRASPNCLNVQWLTDIICHLRDDLAAEQDLPPDADIVAWVQQAYYPGLLELTWEEAVLSLLHRMQHAPTGARKRRTDFASTALAQLRRATQASQIWKV